MSNQHLEPDVEKSDGGVGNADGILGLVGGLGVGATIYFYEQLAQAHTTAGRPMQLLMAHADVDIVRNHVTAREYEPLADYLAGLIARMAAGGATVAAIPAVTPHVCLPYLMSRSPLPLINVVDETARAIRARGLRRVSMLGTRWVVESRMFGMLPEVEVVLPTPEEMDLVHRTYFSLVDEGRGSDHARATLTGVAQALIHREHVDAIVLAGTEMALVFGEENTPFPAVDCTRIQLDAILAYLLAK